jgi:small-conductance mechanosensitive channel
MQTESNVRFLIEKHLREAEIVVAFPQRDVHMETSKPLDLRIINVAKDELPGP